MVIIIRHYFPFYEFLPHTETRADPNFSRVLVDGMNCWQNDTCHQLHTSSSQIPVELRNQVKRIFMATATTDKVAHFPHELSAAAGRWQCTCAYWSRTGKQCAHLWASGILADFGSIHAYEYHCDLIGGIRGVGSSKRKGKAEEIDPSERTLGYQSMPDEEEDLAGYWKEDIFATQYLGDLNTCPDMPPDRLAKYQEQLSGAIKGAERMPRKAPTYRPGRAPAVEPMNKRRRKGPKSLINPPDGAQARIDSITPSGIYNTGNDCFGSSLLQILIRQSVWKATFTQARLRGKDFQAVLYVD